MQRYGTATSLVYDAGSGERLLYRAGRLAAIEALRLTAGDRVLVLGCGTGLDLPPIAHAVGPTGEVVAVDSSPAMLRRTARRFRDVLGRRRSGAPRLHLVRADAARARTLLPPGVAPVDAVLAVNTLSLIPDWRRAWSTAAAAARPGARIAVADVGHPDGSAALEAWTQVISRIGGWDPDAQPWRALEEGARDVRAQSFLRGHVQVRTGRLP